MPHLHQDSINEALLDLRITSCIDITLPSIVCRR